MRSMHADSMHCRQACVQALQPRFHGMCVLQVEVRGVDGELKRIAESKLSIKPNFAYTLSEVRDDIQRVFDAGYFQQLTPVAEDTRDGIKLTLQVWFASLWAGTLCERECHFHVMCLNIGEETR